MTQNPFQKLARAAIGGKRYPGEDPDLDYIMSRLSGVGRRVEAIASIEMLATKAQLIHRALLRQQAIEQLGQGTPSEAALWFLENIADDNPDRSDLFFIVKKRLSE